MTPFHVGMKVVCITSYIGQVDACEIVKGQIYTIRDLEVSPFPEEKGELGIRLVEIYRYVGSVCEYAFRANYFRPVVKTDISLFQSMLSPTPHEKVGA